MSTPANTTTSANRRVLFVDDEPAVLKMLEMLFLKGSAGWEFGFAADGAQGLEFLRDKTVDLVVSDMRMPGMDGAEFLNVVRERYPQTARMILSGYADQQLVMKSLGVAHQFVSKPFDVRVLRSTVRRLAGLRDVLSSDHLRVVEGKVQCLPSLPALYGRLMEELASPEATTDSVGDLIAQDVSLTAKLLQLVNSAFFGVAQPVTSAREACQILGFSLVRTLALSIYVFSRFDPSQIPGFPIDRLWRHSMATGLMARRIASRQGANPDLVETAFTAGVLHDIGKLALAFGLPELYASVIERAVQSGEPTQKLEREILGAGHAEVGGYLLGLWGLPNEIVEAVASHHDPRDRDPAVDLTDPVTAVHLAEFIHSRKTPVWDPAPPADLDREFLRQLGAEDQVEVFLEEDEGL